MEQNNLITPNYNQPANLPNATASLVLGIIAIVGAFCYGIVGLVCGIIGLVLANKDRKLYQSAPELYSASSFSTSNAGRICSIIGLIISGLIVLLMIIYFVFFGALFFEAIRNAQ
ncbi:MAG TPA: CCC motif membrane protein [Ferruginibacter sp.]|nr:CCC motif membrane protein [Ferruginibacter sp.]